VDAAARVPAEAGGRERDDADVRAGARGRGAEHGQELLHEQRVPEVVYAELALVPVVREAERGRHHARVAHEHVEPVRRGEDAVGGDLDRRERREVARDEDEVRAGSHSRDARGDGLCTRLAAARKVDRGGPVLGDLEDGLGAEPGSAWQMISTVE
jgi:hypothetical protein